MEIRMMGRVYPLIFVGNRATLRAPIVGTGIFNEVRTTHPQFAALVEKPRYAGAFVVQDAEGRVTGFFVPDTVNPLVFAEALYIEEGAFEALCARKIRMCTIGVLITETVKPSEPFL